MKIRTYIAQLKNNAPILFSKPSLLVPMGIGIFKGVILKQPVLRYLELQVTTECNQKCESCFASNATIPGRKQLSLNEIKSIWRELKQNGVFQGIITGGEPTVRKDLFDILKILETHKYMFGMTTNAILLTKEYVRDLKRIGLDYLAISLNSMNPIENDRQRGTSGHFEKVMQTIEWAKEYKLPVGLSTVLSHQNFDDFERMAQFCQKNGIQICPAFAVSQGRWTKQDGVRLTADDYIKLRELNERYPAIRSELTTNMSLKNTCPGGTEKLYVSVYGDVTTCQLNPVSFGNVRELPIKNIVDRILQIKSFSQINPSCVVSSDEEYIDKYIGPIADQPYRPVPIDDHPID